MENNSHAACTTVLVGKGATLDGSTMIARNGDSYEVLVPKKFTVHPHQVLEKEETYVSPSNRFTITLPKERYRYTAIPDREERYVTFEDAGINEKNVGMSATESIYGNPRVLGYDPLVENGIAEDCMVTVVLPYINSAREGVQRLGAIVEKYGAAESNGVLFSDKEEVWYMEIATGHQWVAQRIPDDSYAVVANQTAIQEIDPYDKDNFLLATHLIEFIEKYHLNTGFDTINFRNIFGRQNVFDRHYNTPRVWYGQKYLNPEIEQDPMSNELPFLRKASRKIAVDDIAYILDSYYQETPFDPLGSGSEAERTAFRAISLNRTQDSHILQIRPDVPDAVAGIQWVSLAGTFSPYVPFYTNITSVPESYEVTPMKLSLSSAYWLYKTIPVIVEPHYHAFLKQVLDYKEHLYSNFLGKIAETDEAAKNAAPDEVADVLTEASSKNAELALSETRDLLQDLTMQSMSMSKLTYNMDKNL
ncbi:C69 family dipeptidase [Sporolactobacillus shoreicorticis]|uniref:Dipeptidase n=1 Tax=Sporolactobacillus shoreicorticis TaxID=1923877 RepID=A0ABW5S3V1_9BACL|nr:C69 family dipeptidase [Sporolactobacillus shoreicorticis]MCO7124318.1 C69 family dipeptidase [Sporolactobacillus shoreicorticis]